MVVGEDLAVLDDRERGYERVPLKAEHLKCEAAQGDLTTLVKGRDLWMYVPLVQQKVCTAQRIL